MEDIILLLIWTCGLSLVLAIGCWIADLVDRVMHPELFDEELNPQARQIKRKQ